MSVSLTAIIVATVLQFIVGALWYSPLVFGKWWMQVMEMTNKTKEEIAKIEKEMIPFYGLQFFLILFTTFALANHMSLLPGVSPIEIAFWVWLGYMAPIQIATVIWGNTKKKFWIKQIFIMVSAQFVCMMIAGVIFANW
jgi:Protein of unknown function (DUF1761)